MSYNKIPFVVKAYGGFTAAMSVYGFSRGFRTQRAKEDPRLLYHKCWSGVVNGVYYAYPIVNLLPLCSLFGRLEIELRGLDRRCYGECYDEMSGKCMDTI